MKPLQSIVIHFMIVMPSKRRRFAAHRSFLDQVIETSNPGPHKPASPKIGPLNVGLIERLGNTFASAFLGTCNLVKGPLSRRNSPDQRVISLSSLPISTYMVMPGDTKQDLGTINWLHGTFQAMHLARQHVP